MNSYRVTFFKQIHNSTGHSFKCAQSSFDIVSADPTEAVNTACQQLARNHRVNDWKKIVDSFEVKLMAPEGAHA